jgi:protocatechuate 3,4-dioxygenase beta subunit
MMYGMRLAVLAFSLAFLAACAGPSANAPTATPGSSPTSAATPSPAGSQATTTSALDCTAPAQPIVQLTEGPYYKAGAPQRSSLLTAGVAGTPLVLTGYVVTRSCQPIANAKLDFWQADGNGNYDNSGYTLRGWLLTDANGAYRLETVIPGLYPGRTEHIHFKVTAGGQTYTSQLFFPGVSQNEADSIYSTSMLVKLDRSTNPITAAFTFVVNTA